MTAKPPKKAPMMAGDLAKLIRDQVRDVLTNDLIDVLRFEEILTPSFAPPPIDGHAEESFLANVLGGGEVGKVRPKDLWDRRRAVILAAVIKARAAGGLGSTDLIFDDPAVTEEMRRIALYVPASYGDRFEARILSMARRRALCRALVVLNASVRVDVDIPDEAIMAAIRDMAMAFRGGPPAVAAAKVVEKATGEKADAQADKA